MKHALIGLIALVAVAGCATTPEAPSTVTETVTATVTKTAVSTSTETVKTTVSSSASPVASSDAAACRLIVPALSQSGLQQLSDRQSAGSEVIYGDVVSAGRIFLNLIGGAPANASPEIAAPFVGLTTALSELETAWQAMPDVRDDDAITNGLLVFPVAVSMLNDACA